jgi:hypothetical protein
MCAKLHRTTKQNLLKSRNSIPEVAFGATVRRNQFSFAGLAAANN